MTHILAPRSVPFIKVCGQTHASTVDCAAAYGARLVGFIFHPSSPRSITPARAAAIPTPHMRRVGVFVRQHAEDILPVMEEARLDFAQFHGRQTMEDADAVGSDRVIRVLWPEQAGCLDVLQEQIDAWAPHCACYLLDAGSSHASGGLGRQLPAAELASLSFPHPWILAGGLNARNIPEALRLCHPDGIDLNSGVETAPGMKSPASMLAAFTAFSRALADGSVPSA